MSKLQELILLMLTDPESSTMSRLKFNDYVYRIYFGKRTASAQASLSRAFRRLEQRGYLISLYAQRSEQFSASIAG
jgi:hypothetical protein